jgi:hypothetical protein
MIDDPTVIPPHPEKTAIPARVTNFRLWPRAFLVVSSFGWACEGPDLSLNRCSTRTSQDGVLFYRYTVENLTYCWIAPHSPSLGAHRASAQTTLRTDVGWPGRCAQTHEIEWYSRSCNAYRTVDNALPYMYYCTVSTL